VLLGWSCHLFFGLFDGDLVGGESAGPKAVELRSERAETVCADGVDASVAGGLIDHQPGILEDPEVLRDCGPADGEAPSEIADGGGPFGQTLKDRAPGGIAERRPCCKLVSRHAQ
jgi:hypothetical protein